jgi:hypothetical protein
VELSGRTRHRTLASRENAGATLDVPPAEFDDLAWLKEKARIYGRDWPDVQRLLNALRQYGIDFCDVDLLNISLRP